jgi:hypothetical protein
MTSVIYLILLNFNEKIYLYILSELFAFLVCESSDLRLGFRFFFSDLVLLAHVFPISTVSDFRATCFCSRSRVCWSDAEACPCSV